MQKRYMQLGVSYLGKLAGDAQRGNTRVWVASMVGWSAVGSGQLQTDQGVNEDVG